MLLRDGSCCLVALVKHARPNSNSDSTSTSGGLNNIKDNEDNVYETGPGKPLAVTVATLGDSRAVICRNGTAFSLSRKTFYFYAPDIFAEFLYLTEAQ